MIVESYEDVIILSGALRSNYWETLHTAISLTLKRHPSGVIIDCSGLTEATCEGAGTFRDVMEFIRNQDARVIVASVPENILDVLKTVPEVRSQLATSSSVEEARQSLDLLQKSQAGKKKSVVECSSRLMVLLTGTASDREALVLASQMADARNGELHLLYVVIIPRDLPLTAPMPKEEGLAAFAIEKARGYLDKQSRATPHIERGRDLATTVESFALTSKASVVLLPIAMSQHEMDGYAKVFRTLVSRLSQELIFVKAPSKSGA